MFKYNLWDKVLYDNKEYEIVRRRYVDTLDDQEPSILYMIKSGDEIFNAVEQELNPMPRFTIKIIDNKEDVEDIYYANDISRNITFSQYICKEVNLGFNPINL